MAWRNCNASTALVNAVNAKWPNRSRASDGTIGDAAHATRTSDHNPWVILNGMGIVRARDITADGIDAAWLAEELRKLGRAGDHRLRNSGYVIFNRRITTPDFSGWKAYTGTNPHTKHVHVSFALDAAGYDDGGGWAFLASAATVSTNPNAFPLPQNEYFGDINGPAASHGGYAAWEKPHIVKIQKAMQNLGYAPKTVGWADGLYENETIISVAAWQHAKRPGTTRFGEVWYDDWAALFTSAVPAPAPAPAPVPSGPVVSGSINDAYTRVGRESYLGKPLTNEGITAGSDPAGRWQAFEDGAIFWHPNVDNGTAHVVKGSIYAKWTELGREVATGFPITDELTTPDGIGRYNHFSGGKSLYYTPETGAHLVGGAFREYWEKSGWEGGPLGYPKSDEYAAHEGVIAQDWTRGVTLWVDNKVFVYFA